MQNEGESFYCQHQPETQHHPQNQTQAKHVAISLTVIDIKPNQVTLVPDAESDLTSYAGWNTIKHKNYLKEVVSEFNSHGIRTSIFLDPELNLPTKFAVLVQNASWPSKQWSISKWQQLINHLDQLDIYTFLPSGNETELKRAKEIASCSEKAIALELMSLNEIAFLIDKADFSVCSDTGLAHLSAIVGTPSITLYGPTDVKLIGTYGENQEHIIAENKDINNIKVDEVVSKLPKIEMLK